MMKPILFNTYMVRAVLEGRKTVTRRVVKPQPEARFVPGERDCYIYRGIPCGLDGMTNFAPYRPGEILYVRETFWQSPDGEYTYKSDYNQAERLTWHPSIHMPREAARIFLRVTDVRVERLQEITEDQALLEGARKEYQHYYDNVITAREVLRWIWDSTIKPADRAIYGWDANPWVWVIEFERCGKPEGA